MLSEAVTRTMISLSPTSKAMAPLAEPLVTEARLPDLPTCTVESLSATVGVSRAWVTVSATVAR